MVIICFNVQAVVDPRDGHCLLLCPRGIVDPRYSHFYFTIHCLSLWG